MGKEAALEEIQRVLAQDDRMYAARTSASEQMMQELRVLEEGRPRTKAGLFNTPSTKIATTCSVRFHICVANTSRHHARCNPEMRVLPPP